MNTLIEKGSKTAKDGFKNEDFVIASFNDWQTSDLAKSWLMAMNYNLNEIEAVNAYKIKGSFKADVQVQINIEIKLKKLQDIQNLQVKLVSNPNGFNQIDKRWVNNYVELWNIPDDVIRVLKYFTGELPPFIQNPKDKRRMFMNEFSQSEQNLLLNFICKNQSLIVSDILKGRGQFAAEWMLVILKITDKPLEWALKPMNFCLNLYGNGDVSITNLGSIRIGKITIQRKGGDGGRKTANMLQFKINPCLLLQE
jgi:R.HinP1I restriction endonuclease